MIVPSVPSLYAAVSVESFVYEIVESAPLSVIDMSKSIRSVWLSERFGETWTSLIRRYQTPMLFVFIGLGILEEAHSFVLFSSHTRAMTAEIALTNGWSTIAAIICR